MTQVFPTDRPPVESAIGRREALRHLGGVAAMAAIGKSAFAGTPKRRCELGLVIYDYGIRRRWLRAQDSDVDLFHPLEFLKHSHAQGAGGMQASLGVMSADEIEALRDFADEHRLFIDAIIKPPKHDDDLGRFEAEVRTARDAGVLAARTTIIPGRRYERFKSLDEFREFERRGRQMLERATPVVERYGVRLAVENHKDQRLDERVSLFEQIDSEFVGACLDTGNSFALLDGVYEPIEALAPYAFTVHLKDQALQTYDDGFLLGDIPLGAGSFDLKRMVETIRSVKPNIRFTLELITRDPLKVPCLTDEYFATLPSAGAQDLARTLRFVRDHAAETLQHVSSLPLRDQVALEHSNVIASLDYANRELAI